MAEIIAAFDVGGTFIKAALFDITGGLRPETYRNYPARADLPKKELLDHFYGILSQQLELAVPGDRLTGIGYSFPGPFSYQEGISLIRGQGKFDSLYQVNLRSEIRRRLREHPLPVPAACEEAILFENDATLFAMGEWRRESRYLPRYLAVTIGTGTGSAFLCDGCAVLSGPGVPPGGWIYSMPFQGTTVDDWISKRGLMRLAEQVGLRAEVARAGGDVFHQSVRIGLAVLSGNLGHRRIGRQSRGVGHQVLYADGLLFLSVACYGFGDKSCPYPSVACFKSFTVYNKHILHTVGIGALCLGYEAVTGKGSIRCFPE